MGRNIKIDGKVYKLPQQGDYIDVGIESVLFNALIIDIKQAPSNGKVRTTITLDVNGIEETCVIDIEETKYHNQLMYKHILN